MDKEILTLVDASKLLSLPEAEVEQLLADGELPGRRVGTHWFISRQRLLQFIACDDPPVRKRTAPSPAISKGFPSKVLSPNWRCESCQEIHPPEVVECTQCGTARNSPLMGFGVPAEVAKLRAGLSPKVN